MPDTQLHIERSSPDTIDEGIIIRQVEKICLSPEFRSKRLLCDFLSYIVSESLAGRSDRIKGYAIGVDVFGRGEDFDPGEDALVRIHAGRLRRMLDLYYFRSGLTDPVYIEVPKGSYAPTFTLRTPGEAQSKMRSGAKPMRSLIEPGVILMPFKNLTGNPELDYFAHGFSEELSLELTKFEDLVVYDNSSCRILNEKDDDLIGKLRERGIRFMVEGGVKQATGVVKVLVKLTDVQDESQMWGDRYTKDLTASNLNEIQEDIAHELAHRLGNEYGIILQRLSLDASRIRPQNMDTYVAMLKYYHFLAEQTPEKAKEATSSLNQALQAEPDSAIAMALLSCLYGNNYLLDYPFAEDAFIKMGELAEAAASIDPNSSLVKACLVYKCFAYNEKERFFNLADHYLSMVLNNSIKMGSVAYHLALYGGWERGMLHLGNVMKSCQEFPKIYYGATTLYYYRKYQYERALAEARKYDLPSMFWGPLLRIAVQGQLGRTEENSADIALLLKLKPDFEKKAAQLISRYVKEDSLVQHVMEGLRKGGLNL